MLLSLALHILFYYWWSAEKSVYFFFNSILVIHCVCCWTKLTCLLKSIVSFFFSIRKVVFFILSIFKVIKGNTWTFCEWWWFIQMKNMQKITYLIQVFTWAVLFTFHPSKIFLPLKIPQTFSRFPSPTQSINIFFAFFFLVGAKKAKEEKKFGSNMEFNWKWNENLNNFYNCVLHVLCRK